MVPELQTLYRSRSRVVWYWQVCHERFDDQILGMQMLPTKQLLFWTRRKIITATTNLV